MYTSQHRQPEETVDAVMPPNLSNSAAMQNDFSSLLDPAVLQAARQIYRTYYEVHVEQVQRPIGVVIHRETCRGQLVFAQKPILLPQECFVPLDLIDAA
ncbi:MAG: hypothetical protein WBA43_07890 [Elainellaceae cyanobacterium]